MVLQRDARTGHSITFIQALSFINPSAEPQTLLDIDLAALDPERLLEPHGWILTLRTKEESFGNFNGAMAHIELGEGGLVTELFADVAPGFSLQCPASRVRVNIQPNTEAFGTAVNGATPAVQRQRVTGILRRGATSTRALKSHVLAGALPATIEAPIPPYAERFALHSAAGNAIYGAGVTLAFLSSGGAAAVTYTGPMLRAALEAGQELIVPPLCSRWQITGGAAVGVTGALLSFRIAI